MLTADEARARVARGAAHLDVHRPCWFNDIDVGTLTLSDPCGCIVGQLVPGSTFSNFSRMARVLFPIAFNAQSAHWGIDICSADTAADNHGLASLEAFAEPFMVLQDAWIEAICDRRLKAAPPDICDVHILTAQETQ